MDFIWQSITDWLKEILVSGVISNLTNMFDSTNTQVGGIVGQVGLTPQAWKRTITDLDKSKIEEQKKAVRAG